MRLASCPSLEMPVPAYDGVDPVAVTLGVGGALQDDDADALYR